MAQLPPKPNRGYQRSQPPRPVRPSPTPPGGPDTPPNGPLTGTRLDTPAQLQQAEAAKFLRKEFGKEGLITSKRGARSIYLRPIVSSETNRVTKTKELTDRGLWFPVAPDQYRVSAQSRWQEVEVIGGGVVAHPTGPPLRTIQFSSFFPSTETRTVSMLERLCRGLVTFRDFTEPKMAVWILETLRDSNDIFWLVTGTDLESRFTENPYVLTSSERSNILKVPVRITSFTWWEAAGRSFDILFDIEFAEYIPQQLRLRGGTTLAPLPKTYKPKKDEDLRDVAIRFYGDPKKWKVIAAFNKDRLDPKSDKIPKKDGVPITIKLPKGHGKGLKGTGRTVRDTSTRALPVPETFLSAADL